MPQATAVSLIEFNLSFTQWRKNSTKLCFERTEKNEHIDVLFDS